MASAHRVHLSIGPMGLPTTTTLAGLVLVAISIASSPTDLWQLGIGGALLIAGLKVLIPVVSRAVRDGRGYRPDAHAGDLHPAEWEKRIREIVSEVVKEELRHFYGFSKKERREGS